ncbi:MAG TPA: ABC transporter ATP-binding protein [Aquihabitans sp.]|jgi:ABC-2 type transport system ATP-binding protein|nr:ABC transporter ATP-binding protein [Aquihabitans sp.]
MGDRAIDCTGLTRHFASGTALDGLTIDVERGEVLALLGPNGAGKTTTMRLLDGVLRPHGGTATVLDLDPWSDGDRLRARTGVLTENAGLDDRFTALENLQLMAELRGIDRREARTKGGELLERFGMGDRADVKVQGFSTGQRKRVALARALLHDPDLLFLDEPTSGLDPAATRDVVDLIGSLAAEHGRTVVLCTHFLGEAGKLANRMAVLFSGRLHAFGTPTSLAADLWRGSEVRLDLGGPPPDALLPALAALDEVVQAVPTPGGALVRVTGRAAIPAVVATAVATGAPVHGVDAHRPTLEDVYFEIEARSLAAAAAAGGTGEPAITAPVAAPR